MFRFFGNANQVYGCVIPRLIKRDAPDRHECWVRGAMDALVCGDEARWRGRQKRVVPISRRWDQVSRGDVSREATVAKTPGHRGERAISRKPLRRECRHVRRTCHDLRACFLPFLHARLRVRFGIRHSLRPLDFGGTKMMQSSGALCREDADSHPPRCHAPRKRGIQNSRGVSVKYGRLWNTGSPDQVGR